MDFVDNANALYIGYHNKLSTNLQKLEKLNMRFYNDDTDTLRQTSIVDYMENQGFTPAKRMITRNELLYLSPFRTETKPSFSVNTEKNVWYDHGTGEGGDIFALVMRLWSVDFHKAKEILREKTYKQIFYRPVETYHERVSPFTDISVSPLTSKYFLGYCASRCIDLEVAKAECRQVDYRLNGQMHSAIGFENDKGGWELRSPMSKICTVKSISKRKRQESNDTICVFEGFFDYLSFLTMMKPGTRHKCDYVILNSVSMASKAIPILRQYKNVRCYFDNDKAGQNAFEIVKKEVNAISCSEKMLPHNDVNDYLCAIMAEKPACTQVDLESKKCNSLRIAEKPSPVGRNLYLEKSNFSDNP